MSDKDRKAEIERRRKRLEELRQARDVKKKEVRDKDVSNHAYYSYNEQDFLHCTHSPGCLS